MRASVPLWRRLGLDPDEWRECRAMAAELALLDAAAPSADQIAREFAWTKAFDVELTLSPAPAGPAAGRPRLAGASR